MGKKRWDRKCAKMIQPGGSQSGNTHDECMHSVGYGMVKPSSGGTQGPADALEDVDFGMRTGPSDALSGVDFGRRRFIRRGRFR